MKSTLVFLALILAAIFCRADDELVSVDAGSGMITIQQKGTLKSYRLKPFTDVVVNGQKGTLAHLKAGMQVTVTLADPQTASKITAKGNVPAGAPPLQPLGGGPRPPIGANNAQQVRKITIKATVDGDDTFTIQDGHIRIKHGGWQKPIDISVNGIKWKPDWDDNTSEDFTAVPMAPFAGANVTVKMNKGRGEMKVIEPPTDANGQRLKIHVQDEGGGASLFEVFITW
jgi:hypothetical protein